MDAKISGQQDGTAVDRRARGGGFCRSSRPECYRCRLNNPETSEKGEPVWTFTEETWSRFMLRVLGTA